MKRKFIGAFCLGLAFLLVLALHSAPAKAGPAPLASRGPSSFSFSAQDKLSHLSFLSGYAIDDMAFSQDYDGQHFVVLLREKGSLQSEVSIAKQVLVDGKWIATKKDVTFLGKYSGKTITVMFSNAKATAEKLETASVNVGTTGYVGCILDFHL